MDVWGAVAAVKSAQDGSTVRVECAPRDFSALASLAGGAARGFDSFVLFRGATTASMVTVQRAPIRGAKARGGYRIRSAQC